MDDWCFGPILIRPPLRQVWVKGVLCALGARAFDLLVLLVQHRDRVVSKDEIFAQVWPGLVVEENNLSVQVHALRRLLGAEAIRTVTGRGYQFVAVSQVAAPPTVASEGNLPVRQALLHGRELELAEIRRTCTNPGCLTLCGTAGVGKTALATLAAQRLVQDQRYAQGAWRIDLTEIQDPQQVLGLVRGVLGLEWADALSDLKACLAQLAHRELLLFLDNCEHVIEPVAELVAGLMERAAGVTVLATSQEPLRIPGEVVMRLQPLEIPPNDQVVDAEAYSAIRLMRARIQAAMGGSYEPSAEELEDLIDISRQLDGIPLALEFAASRIPILGSRGVRQRLNDRLHLLSGGARATPHRHQSLQAALEWSHQLLADATRLVFQRLAIFPAGFSLEGACLLFAELSESELIQHLDVLVDRSMLMLEGSNKVRYRMLETTRSFALDELRKSGAYERTLQRFVTLTAELCVSAARGRETLLLWQEMPNVRAALGAALQQPALAQSAVVLATYSSVVLGAGGALREALDNLQKVHHLVQSGMPEDLVARYWHWLGRLGVEGRMPSSICIDALQRALAYFSLSGQKRHLHACYRHLAEAEVRSGQLDAAQGHLSDASALEEAVTSTADRMRRMRVEALLAQAYGRHESALRLTQMALSLSEQDDVDRYRLLLLADVGWIHLQMGHAEAAVTSFQELLLHLSHSIRQSLARARAQTGLTVALVIAGRVDDAMRSANLTVAALLKANLLKTRCEVFAWVLAAGGRWPEATQLLGAAQSFKRASETEPDPISQLASQCAQDLVIDAMSNDDFHFWQQAGVDMTEEELRHMLERCFVDQGPL